MINSFLTDVLGYIPIEEVKTEYMIRGIYADYVIQTKGTRNFLVEVKALSLTLSDKHLRQAINYGFDREKMISSIVMFGATYQRPGEVTFNFEGDWILGKPFVVNDEDVTAVAEILKKAFSVVVTGDITGMKWLKLFVNFNNCVPALIGKSMQETFADLDLCRLSILLLKEGVGIVQKAKVNLVSLPQFPVERILGLAAMPVEQGAEIIKKTLTGLSKEPLYGSILQSIMRRKTSEIDYINGEVTFLAKNVNLPAPLNRKVVDLVHQVERDGKFFDKEKIKREFSLN